MSHQVFLNAGQQQIAIAVPAGGWNINWLKIQQGNGARISQSSAVQEEESISVHPNPATSHLVVNGITSPTEVTTYNTSGKAVTETMKVTSTQHEINIKTLKPGLYIIKLKNGKTLRFAKE
ncbi:hypothetical protein DQQ10_24775 [Pseudochryseolinea flava]|uniref:Secretion system C-terminal sorting domain-containing protein n=1 Tax=Pseudochryseolinea flava TaxID=2059302 RepID=A0A364XXI7_9BACT|nr:hypothetical protein DQQ10_24775 [Pseudochryseolinea flava]